MKFAVSEAIVAETANREAMRGASEVVESVRSIDERESADAQADGWSPKPGIYGIGGKEIGRINSDELLRLVWRALDDAPASIGLLACVANQGLWSAGHKCLSRIVPASGIGW
jgi:hypothetical protein